MGGAPDGRLDVRVLGPLEALRNGDAIALGGAKPRALLTALTFEPRRVVSVDRLVESLWPGDPPDTAAHAVQVYVSQLRGALGSDAIARRGPGYALEIDPDSVDAHRFARLAGDGRAALHAGDATTAVATLRDALGLWRGPALADFLYEPFAQLEIARLEDLRLGAVEDRIEAELATGAHADLVAELEALVDLHPLRERPRALLMLALYRGGRQADALAVYRRARETLVEELGIEPGPALKELEAAILRQDEALLPPASAPARPMQFRRLVTILHAVVRSSSLDAEAAAAEWRRHFGIVAAAVTQHGGTVDEVAGDAMMAAFGIPASHEDDPLRAARAALAIREELPSVDVRIGIETGEVVATPGDAQERFAAGEAVGTAARLAHAAEPRTIVVGTRTGRLIDHAAVLAESDHGYRLLELAAVAPAFERRLDAPFVGRKPELAALRAAFEDAVADSSPRSVLVVGSAGVGKSRLATELAGQTREVTTLVGRCLSYGDGITYWPVREVLEQVHQSAESDAILAALEADTPPPVAELALDFRRFCAERARERPLILVFDDLHWAEPTFLDLVEDLESRGDGPMLIVCLAREELLESRPQFLTGAERLALEALSDDETGDLLDGLGGGALETDQRDRVVDAAEGNPLFLEQLLALALEGAGDRAMPETLQALLAARLDRLGPGERAVLERGSIVGKEFTADDVAVLLEPDAAHTVKPHLDALTTRGFVRPRGQGGFGFRHSLVQESVYRAAPKRLRTELHERFGRHLDLEYAELAELDEFVGYHLEQAHLLRIELGETDELADEAGRRLGAAGTRALRRGDVHAAANLLERATALLSTEEARRGELLCELGLVRVAAHDSDGAIAVLTEAIAEARKARDARIEARARIELEYIRLRREPQRTTDELLKATDAGIPIFDRASDRRALGRAWLLAGFVHGGHRGDHRTWQESAERALSYYEAVGWPTSTCVGEIAAALYWGPTPVADAVLRCESLLGDETLDLPGTAYLHAFLGGLVAQLQEFDRARELVASARATLDDLGLRAATETYCTPLLGEIELLAGNAASSAQILRVLCERLDEAKDFSHLASRASELAEALAEQGLYAEAEEWTRVAEEHAAGDDLKAQMMWRPIRARIHARREELAIAEELAGEAVALAERTDDLNRRAKTQRDLGDVLRLAGNSHAAVSAFARAVALYEQKGNLAGAARVRAFQAEPAPL